VIDILGTPNACTMKNEWNYIRRYKLEIRLPIQEKLRALSVARHLGLKGKDGGKTLSQQLLN